MRVRFNLVLDIGVEEAPTHGGAVKVWYVYEPTERSVDLNFRSRDDGMRLYERYRTEDQGKLELVARSLLEQEVLKDLRRFLVEHLQDWCCAIPVQGRLPAPKDGPKQLP